MKHLAIVLPFAIYAPLAALRGDSRPELWILLGVAATLALAGPRARAMLGGLYPFGLVALLYDAMRPYQRIGLSASRVLLCDLRDVEARFFGWESGGQRLTLHDHFVVHHTPALDLLCAFPYATFLLWCVAFAVFLYVKDRPAMKRFAWGFFFLNVLGFATYHLLPAAPPWYFHANGCVVDLAAHASEGPALARVDRMLGVPYFAGMYGKASSVFGALPSLHCAYPLLLVLEGWRSFGPRLRAVTIAYWLLMIFSAVYLDHHWVLDALLGALYAVLVWGLIRAANRLAARARLSAPASAPGPARVPVRDLATERAS